jgi:hypothetical protein
VRRNEGFFEALQCNVQKWTEVKNGEWSIVNWSEVKIFGKTCVLSLIYSYVAVCSFCAVSCVIIICFPLIFSNYLICFLIFFIIVFYFMYSVFFIFCVYYFSFCIQLSLSYYCTSLPTTATVWKPNCCKYHNTSYHIIISYHIIK